MRSIKFRAWSTKGGAYIAGFNMSGFSNFPGGPPQLQRFSTEWDVSAFILEQYTGLKDKYGIEIYEGDIVQVDDSDEINIWMRGEICTIVFLPGRFKIQTSTGDGNMMQEDLQDVVQVIGNIQEHPGLLT